MVETGHGNRSIDVFISHAHADKAQVDALAKGLEQAGVQVWVDRTRLRGGVNWAAKIEKAIRKSDIVIAALSPQANDSIWVRREIAFAQQEGKPIVPALVSGDKLPVLIAEAQWVDFRPGAADADALRNLLAALDEALADPQAFRASSIPLDSLPSAIASTPNAAPNDPPAQVVDLHTRYVSRRLSPPISSPSTTGSPHDEQLTGTAPRLTPTERVRQRGRGLLWMLTVVSLLALTVTLALTLLNAYRPNWAGALFPSAHTTATTGPQTATHNQATATTGPATATTTPPTSTATTVPPTATTAPATATTIPVTAVPTAPPGNPGSPLWSYKVGQEFVGSPNVVNGVVYVGSDDHNLYALRANTGTVIWKYKTGNNIVTTPAVLNGVVYVTSTDHYLSALRAADGSLIWSYRTGYAIESSPTVVNGMLYFGSDDHYVYALRAGDGALMWKYKTANNIVSAPAMSNNVVYVTSTDHYVSAINAANGSLIWSYQTGYAITGAPAVAGGVVYVGAEDGVVYALRAVDGAVVWRAAIAPTTNATSAVRAVALSGEGPPDQVNSPTVVSGVVYITATVFSFSGSSFSSVNTVEALRTSDGSVLWKVQGVGVTPLDSDTAPTVANGVVYTGFTFYSFDFNATGYVSALRTADGSLVWKSQGGGFGLGGASPAVANGIVYISSADGKVYALHA